MANVINKTTLEAKRSVNTPDFDAADWLIYQAADAAAWAAATAIPRKYRKLSAGGGAVEEMSQAEKDVVDAADAAVEAERQRAIADLDDIRNQFAAIRDDIQQVINGTASNITQVNAALDMLAGAQLRMLKGLYRVVTRGVI